jgi:UDP-N-acetyl-D-glucosamine dehydrogenase
MTPTNEPVRETVSVIGIGYVGLAVAVAAAAAGYPTFGLDINAERVAQIQGGRSPVDTVTDAQLAAVARRLTVTTEPEPLTSSGYILICVPTGVDELGRPELTQLIDAARSVALHLRTGQCVIVESTTYPGTTEGLIKPILERSGLRAGVDFSLAYSPERIDPGNRRFTLRNTPKLVGGLTERCRDRAADFYRDLVGSVYTTRGPGEAEAAKLLENTFRQVNIALVNEFAQLCQRLGIDVWDTIEAAATKPFGFMAFRPGPGVGGHCIPVAPRFLVARAREVGSPFRLAGVAHEVNEGMAQWLADRICDHLAKMGIPPRYAKLLVLGATYKPDVADTRYSPAIGLLLALRERGVTADFHDPYAPVITVAGDQVKRVEHLDTALAESDLAILVQPHERYDEATLAHAPALFDVTGTLNGTGLR